MPAHYPFGLEPLPYSYNALEPYIDAETVSIHHDKHLKTYVDKLNAALEPYPALHGFSLSQLLSKPELIPKTIQTTVKNNGGGVYYHNLYFNSMNTPWDEPTENLPVIRALLNQFGSLDAWKARMKKHGENVFGSGWSLLVLDPNRRFQVVPTPNQDSTLPQGLVPLLPLDVWEHAYYLKYQNRRTDYIDAWFHVINWNAVNNRYVGQMLLT